MQIIKNIFVTFIVASFIVWLELYYFQLFNIYKDKV